MPTSVIASERMKLVDHHCLDVLEELTMIDFRQHQDRFEGFRRREKAVGGIDHDSPPVSLAGVTVPASRTSANQLEVALEPLLLIVQSARMGLT